MTQEIRRASYMGIATGMALIGFAIAILIAYSLNDWLLFFPTLILLMGIFGMAIGIKARSTQKGGIPSESEVAVLWGLILTVMGAVLLLNYIYPGNTVLLIAIFLIVMGIAITFISIINKKPKTT